MCINVKKRAWRHQDVTHVPLVTRLHAVIKTMWKMWIQLLCACVLYSMGSRGLSCPNMGICDVNQSPDQNTRFWLVEKIFAALWLVSTQRGQYHYLTRRKQCFPQFELSFSLRVKYQFTFQSSLFIFSADNRQKHRVSLEKCSRNTQTYALMSRYLRCVIMSHRVSRGGIESNCFRVHLQCLLRCP